ncbi:MAG: YkgJ family cysteine cluster protein [Deltaproteobacteria bacterium]
MEHERDTTVPECLRCGACCHGDAGWVHLDADDDERVEASPPLRELVEVTVRGGMSVHSLRMVRGACAALRSVQGETRCAGYEARPAVCRALERGSAACLAAIARSTRAESVPPAG